MEKAKLKYIEEQCNRIADGMERLSGFIGKGQLHLYEHIDISKGIEIIAAALHLPVRIECGRSCYWRTVTHGKVTFRQMGFYSTMC